MRFAIRRSSVWIPLLAALGATRRGSYVEVQANSVQARFGALFDEVIPREEIVAASATRYPWWGRIGLRTNLRGKVGLIGSHRGVVKLELREPRRVKLGPLPLKCRTLFVSLEAPETFLSAVQPSA